MNIFIILLRLVFGTFGISEHDDFKIEYVENINGDFSFSKKNSLECYAWCGGVSEIEARRSGNKTIRCYTLTNKQTSSVLNFDIVGDVVRNARIEVHGKSTDFCRAGYMKIEKQALKSGILKAEFEMTFNRNTRIQPARLMLWNGKIYTKIK